MANHLRQERADALGNEFAVTGRVEKAFARIDDLMARGWEKNYCRAMLLLGHSRAGKTHIVTNFIRVRVDEQPDPDKRPVIILVEVPASCTLKIFATDLLDALGDPDPEFGSQPEKTRRIKDLIEELGVDLVIIDEAQRLIDSDTDKVKSEVASWLTALLNKRLCPILLVGERKAERVFQGKMHLTGRTLGEFIITPYDWADESDRKEFIGVLHLLDKRLGMQALSGLARTDTALRIYAYAEGLLGQTATLIDQARSIARRYGRPTITHDIFAEAVDELRVGEARKQPNPFRIAEVEAVGPAAMEAETHVPRRAGAPRGRPKTEAQMINEMEE